MKYTIITASDRTDATGERFTIECLEKMAETAKGTPIRSGFEPANLGFVEYAKVVQGLLYLTIDTELLENVYVVPAFTVGKSRIVNDEVVYDDIRVMAYGITDKPSDPFCTPLTSKYED